jgi:hypothetical protein
MIRFTDLTDEQLQPCIPAGVDLERFKRIAVTTEKFVDQYKHYLISNYLTAGLYCKEILSTFVSAEHTTEWETEFNQHFDLILQAADAVNELLLES